MSNTLKERDVVLPFPGTRMSYTGHDTKFHGGDGGDDMGGDLERRVERLEGDMLIIKDKLTVLSVRSESFATKSDLAELKGELRSEIASLETKLTVSMVQAISNLQNTMMAKMDRRFDRVDDNTKWRWGSVIIPVGAVIISAVVTFWVAGLAR
ncbi:hypothetical protein LGG40_002909 [Salmonella enterica]|uniref:hypothetical protein n=1 Tax=Salmonella enterica TaxID=28901 RepID=UPI000FBE95E2|nr:hypothetical protein [Salmonella enterica]EAM4335552.1 hypothetical protein [Salmonella enterica subsp. enterica serovar Minnesota]EAP4142811.1 hypothetical protein [Salmonella enterica subsp. enterica serovar Anatum]EBS5589698.1 hypothetical protein [Salmonella enterica subsp. enterica serovar Newport]ECJ8827949.1 hypothetical protein [Salmonella enterica subsp. enterica serovar Oranienburg]EDP9439203.1 hypothetical protein [Salmonella enterica subsp. enterica serovar Irumu]EDR9123338.1 h